MAGDAKIVMSPADTRRPMLRPDADQAWRWIGWFSLALAAAGLGDWIIAWVPLRLGTPEWEFGTIVSSFAGLPLVTMGFAGLFGSAAARGIRWQLRLVGAIVLVWAVMIVAALLVFLLDVPLALQSVQGAAQMGIIKATVKTAMLGVLFTTVYVVIAIGALRRSSAAR